MDVKTIQVHLLHPKNRRSDWGLKEMAMEARRDGGFCLDPAVTPCGFHWVVRRDGMVEQGRPETMPGNHTPGHNQAAIGVAVINRHGTRLTGKPQREAFKNLMVGILLRYPDAEVKYP